MLKTEFYKTRKDGINLYKTYSDKGMYIKQVETEIIYTAAIDVENSGFTYEETETPIVKSKYAPSEDKIEE